MVSSATGNLDGLVTFGGVIVGSVIYGELFPFFSSFHSSSELGHVFLYDLVGLPVPLLAAGVALMALAMFLGAEKVERIFARKKNGGNDPEPDHDTSSRRPAFAVIGAMVLLALVTMGLPGASDAGPVRQPEQISQHDLARRALDEPWSLRVVDIRAREQCAEQRLPGAECVPLAELDNLGLPYGDGTRDLVLIYSNEQTTAALPPAAAAYPGKVLVLDGGFNGWRRYALTTPPVPGAGASDEERQRYRFRAALNGAMTGMKPPPPPAPTGKVAPRPKKKKGGGCS